MRVYVPGSTLFILYSPFWSVDAVYWFIEFLRRIVMPSCVDAPSNSTFPDTVDTTDFIVTEEAVDTLPTVTSTLLLKFDTYPSFEYVRRYVPPFVMPFIRKEPSDADVAG